MSRPTTEQYVGTSEQYVGTTEQFLEKRYTEHRIIKSYSSLDICGCVYCYDVWLCDF